MRCATRCARRGRKLSLSRLRANVVRFRFLVHELRVPLFASLPAVMVKVCAASALVARAHGSLTSCWLSRFCVGMCSFSAFAPARSCFIKEKTPSEPTVWGQLVVEHW